MLYIIFKVILSGLRSCQSLILESIALRHQLEVLRRNNKTPDTKILTINTSRFSNRSNHRPITWYIGEGDRLFWRLEIPMIGASSMLLEIVSIRIDEPERWSWSSDK